MSAEQETRSGFVAVIGSPNVGKSTLVNALVGQKISIVTHKVQTTRFAVRGVMIQDDAQIVLVDTPGVFAPKRRFDKAMVHAAWAGADGADHILHVIDASARDRVGRGEPIGADKHTVEDDDRVIAGLSKAERKAILVLNKVDLLSRAQLLAMSQELYETGIYSDVYMISAKTGSGVEELKLHLASLMKPGPWFYPEDQIADLPARLLAAEVTREKLYLRLHEELPYASMVDTEAWKKLRDGSLRVEQSIIIERDSQKPIVLGKGGKAIKSIGEAARKELEEILECKVHLFLNVKVDPRWMERRSRYADIGLDFDA
jgi:GTP-binding protein Era